MEMIEAVLSGKSHLVLGKENDIGPNLITRWEKQYLEGRFHGNSENDIQIRKLKIKVCELEQMIGKLKKVFMIASFAFDPCKAVVKYTEIKILVYCHLPPALYRFFTSIVPAPN